MTEISYFWDDDPKATGDYAASYSDDLLALYLDLMFNYDRQVPLIAFQEYATYSDPVSVAGTNVQLTACCALVDGRIYINDATISLDTAGVNGHYALILRRDDSGGAGDQTVRADLLYGAVGAPATTQTAATWEVVVARFQVKGGAIDNSTFTYHWRPFPHSMVLPFRGGTSEDDWTEVDTTKDWQLYPTYTPMIQAGVKAHTATGAENIVSVTFPIPFKLGKWPLVFCTPYNLSGNTPSHAYIPVISKVTSFGFDLLVDDDTDIEGIHWIAVGEDQDEL